MVTAAFPTENTSCTCRKRSPISL